VFLAIGLVTKARADATASVQAVCQQIQTAVSSASSVHLPGRKGVSLQSLSYSSVAGDLLYLKDIGHYATSSTASAACSVEPGTAADVGAIVGGRLIYSLIRLQFAASSFKSWAAPKRPSRYVCARILLNRLLSIVQSG
jgi:hypothetical protein